MGVQDCGQIRSLPSWLPLLLRGAVADSFLTEAHLAELIRKALHLRAIRVVFSEEAFFEKKELMLGAGGVVDDGDEEPLEVDFDAGEQLGEWRFFEVLVVVEGEFAGIQVDFDKIGFARVAVEACGAIDIDAEDGGEFVEQASVDGEVGFLRIEVAEVELGGGKFQLRRRPRAAPNRCRN